VTPQATSELERRFGAKAAERWQHVLEHIRLSTGFSYLILLVPEASAARICAAELARHLREQGQELESREFNTPEALREHLAPWMLRETGQQHPIWAASVTSEYDPQHSEWEAAWRYAVARINERRDELIKCHQAPIIMVGAPWLKTVLREAAPDWWSVRSLVVNLKPQFVPSDRKERDLEPVRRMLENDSSDALLDPDEVLEQAELLRGVGGQEENLMILLERAYNSFSDRERHVEAEEVAQEILEIGLNLGNPVLSIADMYHNIGYSQLSQNRLEDAEFNLRKALKYKEENKALLVSKAITLDPLARILQKQGNLEEAELIFRKALKYKEDDRASLVSMSITLDSLARVLRDQGKLEEAELNFRKALKFSEDGKDSLISKGITTHELARTLQEQGDLAEAELNFRIALEYKEKAGSPLTSQAKTLYFLGDTLQKQGKLEQAESILQRALMLGEMDGNTSKDLESIRTSLIGVLKKQENWQAAENLIRQALKQTEGQMSSNRLSLWAELENILMAQDCFEEAQEAAKHSLTES
jgi:tetratricopeptide (TPR) repeat protein